jgi:uncharacterized protein (TIGR02265 family)
MFEGLYDRVLKPQGELERRVRAAGYDASAPKTEYPITVWIDCLAASAQVLSPELPQERAVWLLGRRFIEGYLETLIGKMISASFPFLSAGTFMKRVPRFVSSGLVEAGVSLTWPGETHAVLTVGGCAWYPGPLMGGVIEVVFERLGVTGAQFVANDATAHEGRLEITWPR